MGKFNGVGKRLRMYSKRIEDQKIKEIFKRYAEDEGRHAAELRELFTRI